MNADVRNAHTKTKYRYDELKAALADCHNDADEPRR